MKYLIAIMIIFNMGAFALAEDPIVEKAVEVVSQPETIQQALEFLPVLIQAAKSSQWLMVGALIAMIGTFIAKKWILPKMKVGNGLLPIISVLIGMIGGVGAAIYGGASAAEATMAVLSGPLASSLWDSGAKYFFKKI